MVRAMHADLACSWQQSHSLMLSSPCCAGATLASFALAFCYFMLELCVFQTLSLKRAAISLSAAGKRLL